MPSFFSAACAANKMKKFRFSTKSLCRSALIAALYAVITFALGELAYGPFQIRPAEALCILPLFYIEAIPGLYIGCILANFISAYGVYDIFLGSLATLSAAILTYITGRIIKNVPLKIAIGGFFPIILNAFIVPAVWILAGMEDVVYWYSFGSMILTEGVWIYVLGTPLYVSVDRLIKKGVRVLQPEGFVKKEKSSS